MVSNMDVFPTVCELLGVPSPGDLHGVSMVPLLDGRASSVRDDLFSEINFPAAAEPTRCVRMKDWNPIVRFDDDPRKPLANVDGSPRRDRWLEAGYGWSPRGETRLINLKNDPLEQHDVSGRPETAEVQKELEQRLERWMEATDDPLRKGPLRAPRGAIIATRDALDARGPLEPTPQLHHSTSFNGLHIRQERMRWKMNAAAPVKASRTAALGSGMALRRTSSYDK
jgi:N-sulfoglucosamine sulfohydrolase